MSDEPYRTVDWPKLRRLMQERKLSYYSLAKQADIMVKTLKSWEKHRARVSTLEAVANALSLPYEELVLNEDEATPLPALAVLAPPSQSAPPLVLNFTFEFLNIGNFADEAPRIAQEFGRLLDSLTRRHVELGEPQKGSIFITAKLTEREVFKLIHKLLRIENKRSAHLRRGSVLALIQEIRLPDDPQLPEKQRGKQIYPITVDRNALLARLFGDASDSSESQLATESPPTDSDPLAPSKKQAQSGIARRAVHDAVIKRMLNKLREFGEDE
jgi:transcriptional regulator with XRE-family HTH domain